MALTKKKRAFVSHYLQCWDPREAYIAAGYSEKTVDAHAYRMLKDVDVNVEINRRLEEASLPQERIVAGLAAHATASIGDYIDVKDDGSFEIRLVEAKRAKKLNRIRKVKSRRETRRDEYGRPVTTEIQEIELYDAQAALNILAKIAGLYRNVIEINSIEIRVLQMIAAGELTYDAIANTYSEDFARDLFARVGAPLAIVAPDGAEEAG